MSLHTTVPAQTIDLQQQLAGFSTSPDALKQVAASAPPPLIEDLLPSQAVVTFAGPPGIGKSFTALSWAACVSQGAPWFGKAVQAPQFVFYVLGEGYAQFGNRVAAWENAYAPLNKNLQFVDGAAQGLDLADPDTVTPFIEKLLAVRVYPALIVFDTFAMLARVKSENDNSQVAAAYRSAQRIVRELGSTVVIVHHVSKESGLVRGATAFRGNSDTVIVASESPRENDDSFILSTRGEDDGKQRDGLPTRLEGFEIGSPGVLLSNQQVVQQQVAAGTLEDIMNAARSA